MLHTMLLQASKASGRVGEAGRALAALLEPHFVREEQTAMPLLGLLAPLAAGTPIPDAVATEARAMSAVSHPGLHPIAMHERHESHSLELEPGPGVSLYSVQFAPGIPTA